MRYFASVNGREHVVELTESFGRLRVRVDGRELELDYREVDRLGQVALLVDGRSYAVSIEGGTNACDVTVAGHFLRVELEDERERAAHQAERERGKGGGVVKAIMPGVVLEVLVAEDDEVEEGEPLLVLEAMKMQNEIAAPSAGRVGRIHVAPGTAVGAGAALVTLEGRG